MHSLVAALAVLLVAAVQSDSAFHLAARNNVPLPAVRHDPLLANLFGSNRLNEFFNTYYRQQQFRVKARNDGILAEAFGEHFAQQQPPLEMIQKMYEVFAPNEDNRAISMHDRVGENKTHPDANIDVAEALEQGNSFVFRFEHLDTRASMPLQDSLEALLLTSVRACVCGQLTVHRLTHSPIADHAPHLRFRQERSSPQATHGRV